MIPSTKSQGGMSADVCTIPVDDLIGRGFRTGGRYPAHVLDCWGVVLECFRRRGVVLPDPFVSDVAVMEAKAWVLKKLTGWRRIAQAQPGCVVEFPPTAGVPAHVGFCLDRQRFIHVSNDGAGVIISRLDRDPWQGRAIGFYDYQA